MTHGKKKTRIDYKQDCMKLKGSEEERRPSAEGGATGRVGGLFASRTSEGRLTSRMYFKTGEIKYQELNHLINT